MADENEVKGLDALTASLEAAAAPAASAAAPAQGGAPVPESNVAKKNPGQGKIQLSEEQKTNLSMILDLPLKVSVELGRSRVLIQDILQYGQGTVVELNKKAGDPLEITVHNQLIAKGEVVVVNEKFAVRITEIVDPESRIKKVGEAGKDSTQLIQNKVKEGLSEAKVS